MEPPRFRPWERQLGGPDLQPRFEMRRNGDHSAERFRTGTWHNRWSRPERGPARSSDQLIFSYLDVPTPEERELFSRDSQDVLTGSFDFSANRGAKGKNDWRT